MSEIPSAASFLEVTTDFHRAYIEAHAGMLGAVAATQGIDVPGDVIRDQARRAIRWHTEEVLRREAAGELVDDSLLATSRAVADEVDDTTKQYRDWFFEANDVLAVAALGHATFGYDTGEPLPIDDLPEQARDGDQEDYDYGNPYWHIAYPGEYSVGTGTNLDAAPGRLEIHAAGGSRGKVLAGVREDGALVIESRDSGPVEMMAVDPDEWSADVTEVRLVGNALGHLAQAAHDLRDPASAIVQRIRQHAAYAQWNPTA